MNPLILKYSIKPQDANFDGLSLAYSNELNLTIDTTTGKPAINSLRSSTMTLTRTHNENHDSDANDLAMLMGTITKTSYQIEGTDTDAAYSLMKSFMGTGTLTLVSQEGSDSDR